MAPYRGLLIVGIAFLATAVLFYFLAVTGNYFEKATPPNDIGLYAVTVTLVGFGLATLFLRWARVRSQQASE